MAQPAQPDPEREVIMTKEHKGRLNALLLERIKSLVQHLYPEGHKEGKAWRVGSMDINLRNGFWGDWDGSTESMSRNLLDLWIFAHNVDFLTAVREITDWLGIPESELPTPATKPTEDPQRKLVFPLLEKPTHAELSQLSELRSISVQALLIAAARDFLWMYQDRKEGRCWLITDSARKSAIGRRLDGQLWECNGKKTKTLYGSWGHYPIGIADAGPYPAIGLTEGMPDFLALFDFMLTFGLQDYIAPVCMAGVNMVISESILPKFMGKRVRIFVDGDEEGMAGATRWAAQLREVCEVDGYECAGCPGCKDLNSLLELDSKSWDEHLEEIGCLLDFVEEACVR
jgi:hypothetical protein